MGNLRKEPFYNHLFRDRYQYVGRYSIPTEVTVTSYNENGVTVFIPDLQEPIAWITTLAPDKIHWVQVEGIADTDTVYRVTDGFGIRPIDMKPILTPCHDTKVDDLKDRILVVLQSCLMEKDRSVTTEHICIYSRDNVVITFTERNTDKFDHIGDCLRNNVMNIRTTGPGMLVAFVINSVFSEMIGTALKVESVLEKLDDLLIDAHRGGPEVGYLIQQCRDANLIIQKK